MKENKAKTHWIKDPEESVLEYLKRILDASWIQVIIALMSLIFGILTYYGKDSSNDVEAESVSDVKVLEENVLTYVADIESTINLEDIPTDIDSVQHPDVLLIKTFKILCLDFANKTRELYNTPSVSKFGGKSLDDFMTIEKSWDARMGSRRECLMKLEGIIEKIDSFGTKYGIDNYLINHAIYNDFLEAEDTVSKYSNQLRDQALDIYNKNNATFSESNKDDFLKIVGLQEKACKNIYIYKRDKKLFEYLLFLNKNYDMQLTILKNSY